MATAPERDAMLATARYLFNTRGYDRVSMRQLAEEGMTMLVVTHEMGFARNVSSKTVFMENGVVVEQAPSQQFFASPKEERTRAFLRRIAHTE